MFCFSLSGFGFMATSKTKSIPLSTIVSWANCVECFFCCIATQNPTFHHLIRCATCNSHISGRELWESRGMHNKGGVIPVVCSSKLIKCGQLTAGGRLCSPLQVQVEPACGSHTEAFSMWVVYRTVLMDLKARSTSSSHHRPNATKCQHRTTKMIWS